MSGPVTLLFTDIEDSVGLWEAGREAMAEVSGRRGPRLDPLPAAGNDPPLRRRTPRLAGRPRTGRNPHRPPRSLQEQIGRGGMAAVFRAQDERLQRQVALKILSPTLATDEAFRRRFIRESRSAAAVDDPHIIPVFEAGDADGVLFIAMRYVPGGDVGTLVRRQGPLAVARGDRAAADKSSGMCCGTAADAGPGSPGHAGYPVQHRPGDGGARGSCRRRGAVPGRAGRQSELLAWATRIR